MIRARTAGAKALLLSPVLPTQSHPGAKGLGILAFRRLVRRCPLPVYALGGVNAQTIGLLTGSGAAGAAGIGGFL
jgi:thiamine-phosphate pyrophosphorylase